MIYRNLSDDELRDVSEGVTVEVFRREQCANTIAKINTYLELGGTSLADLGLQVIPEPPADTAPEPEPATTAFAVLAHSPNNRASFWQSINDREWATGAFTYYPGPWGHSELAWDAHWEAAVTAHPEGMDTVVSPKTIDPAKLRDFCERLPQVWRDRMVFAYYQEPEDNFTTQAQIDGFMAQVEIAAGIVRAYGIRNAVELQEWSLDPSNKTYPSGEANTARFVNPALIDHVSWSVYEKNLKDRSDRMIGRIASFMRRWPELTWDISATGVAVPGGTPQGDPKRATRAQITANIITQARAHEQCNGFGWFDFPAWTPALDYGVDPELRAVFAELLGGAS